MKRAYVKVGNRCIRKAADEQNHEETLHNRPGVMKSAIVKFHEEIVVVKSADPGC